MTVAFWSDSRRGQFQAHLEAQLGVDIAQSGSSSKQELGLTGKGTCQSSALFLTVGEFFGFVVEDVVDLRAAWPAPARQIGSQIGPAVVLVMRRSDVGVSVHMREERKVLEGHADVAIFGL